MRRMRTPISGLSVLIVVLGLLTLGSPLFAASTETVLYAFDFKGGSEPYSSLIFDMAGNLYGTTSQGGAFNTNCCGTVFELAPGANGTWIETVLYSFCPTGKCTDGAHPQVGLIFDAVGNLYGTTSGGGAGGGTVFQLTPGTDGAWTETVLHNFGVNKDGAYPATSLIFDSAGDLYGATSGGGSGAACTGGCGTVFELTPNSGGGWTENILHNFNGKDGAVPTALIFDSAGDLYGATSYGGPTLTGCRGVGCGTVFELTPGANGAWSETVLYSFSGKVTRWPVGGLVFGAARNLYGTTLGGASFGSGCNGYGCGAVFELMPGANGKWTEKVLHNFGGKDGSGPYGGLIFDAVGDLYGTTQLGGHNFTGCGGAGCGTVFELRPGAKGKWTEKVLHNFTGKDGRWPFDGLIFNSAGNLYGTTEGGGGHCVGCGAVFEITP